MAASVAKTLARIKGTVAEGAYYEAQQMYKTAFHRSKARNQLADALQILQEGAITQLAHGQVTCGVELGMLLIEAYTTAGTPADEASVGRLLAIVLAFPPLPAVGSGPGAATSAPSTSAPSSSSAGQGSSSPVVDECARFVASAVKWANKGGAIVSARGIHSAFAAYLWRNFGTEGFGRALLHFIRGDDADTFAQALHTCARQGPAEEVDLWLLRALLQVLTAANTHTRMGQLAHARALYDAFTAAQSTPLDTPTAHFAELLLLAVEHVPVSPHAHKMLQCAKQRYGDGVLRRDGQLAGQVERVEASYFGVRRRGAGGGPLGGLLGDLFKSLTEAH
ncbi:hypothetical protein CHLRE_06g282950v5 [Chlamydomonas reinhardtii]|uniref:Golgi to ER traffic protein 4 n=1 Tax=Chlamydomonas reinhardtii TaxID=3055 RepID=A0A2K3DPV5_CHLRE|nr:uncharacterized protein CHLRE_06g282950v5 [Chlamydomonas reinhardtii]PNW82537.1 hypothetical protein CHLRE_06g282950v5 [Chlamydomonas reinhardtii]